MDVNSIKPIIHRVLCIVQQIGKLLINDADEIAEINSVIESIAFEPVDLGASVEAPGAISVTVTLEYQDGSRQEVTYPYYLHDGYTYATDVKPIASFDKYFD